MFIAKNKVSHDTLGDGVVVSSDGEFVSIIFSTEHGIKKLMAVHAAI